MNLHRDLMDREIGTPPPSTLDVDALITRQRRLGHVRQAGLGTLVMAVVVAIGAVLVLLPRSGDLQRDRQVGASPSPSAQPSTAPPSLGTRAAEAARLTVALRQLVSQTLPGATLAKVPASRPGLQSADPLVFVDFGTYFSAAAVVTDAQGTGTITVSVGKEDTQFRADGACMSDPAPLDVKYQCEVKPGVGGINVLRSSSEIGNEHYLRFYLEIIRTDGNAVSVDVSNGVIESDKPYRGQRPQPLLTMDLAVALVQEPSLATTTE